MKILVTGGTVFVSRYVAEYYAQKGRDVYVLNRNTRPPSPPQQPRRRTPAAGNPPRRGRRSRPSTPRPSVP